MKTNRFPQFQFAGGTAGLVGQLIVAFALMVLPSLARAQSNTWTSSSSGSWNSAGNWSGGLVIPGSTNSANDTGTATFNVATSGTATVTVDANRNLENIIFDTNAGSYTFSGGNLLLTSGGVIQINSVVATSGTEAINTPITLEGNYSFINSSGTTGRVFNFGSAATITNAATSGTTMLTLSGNNTGLNTISGIISDSGSGGQTGLFKTGVGSWTLLGANTYSGPTVINRGSLILNGSTGSLNTATVLTYGGGAAGGYGGSGIFNYLGLSAGSSQSLGALTFNSGDGFVESTYGNTGTTNLTFASVAAVPSGATANFIVIGGTNGISNEIVLTGQASGTFLGANEFFGTVAGTPSNFAYYDSGSFVRGVNYTAGSGDTGAVTTTATTSLPTIGNGGGAALYVQNTGAISAQVSGTYIGLNISGASGITQTAQSVLTVNTILKTGGNTATITGGTLSPASGSDLVIDTAASADTITLSSTIVTSGNFVKSGAGTLALTGLNTISGTFFLDAGTVNNNTAAITGATGTGVLVINGGAINNSSSMNSPAFTLTNSSEIWAGDFSASGGGASSSMTLSGSITLTGNRIVNVAGSTSSGAALNIGGAIGDNGNGYSLTWNGGGGRLNLGNNSSYSGVTTINASGLVIFTGSVAIGVNSAFGNASSAILIGPNSGSGTLSVLDNSGANELFARNIILQSGGTGSVTIGSNASNGFETYASTGSLVITGNILLGSGTTGRNLGLTNANVSGNISDPVGLVGAGGSVSIVSALESNTNPVGGSTVTLSGNNTFTGGVLLNGNSGNTPALTTALNINSSTALGTGTFTIVTPTNGSLDQFNTTLPYLALTTNNAQVWSGTDTFVGGGTLDMGSGIVTTNTNALVTVKGHGLIIDGAIGDGGHGYTLTVAGTNSGALVLTGSSTYTGATTINFGGTLQLGTGLGNTGSVGSSVVTDNGTLAVDFLSSGTFGASQVGGSGILTGTGGFTQVGANIETINNAQQYTGNTTVANGTLRIDGSTGSLSGSSSLVFSNNGGTFNYDNTNSSGTQSATLTNITALNAANTVMSTLGGATSGTLAFSGAYNRSVGATVNFVTVGGVNGTSNSIVVAGFATDFTWDQGTFFGLGSANGTFLFDDSSGFARAINYGVDGDTMLSGAGATFASNATGSADNFGSVETTGAITAQTSGTYLSVQISGSNNVTLSSTATLTVSGILKSGSGSATIASGTINGGKELVVASNQSADTLVISSIISGTGALTVSGFGTVTLSGSNTYKGATFLDGGTLDINSVTALGGTNSVFTVNAGATIDNTSGGALTLTKNFTQIWAGDFTFAGSNALNLGTGAVSLGSDEGLTRTITVLGSGTLTEGGIISNGSSAIPTVNLTKSGTGILSLTGNNTYTGVTSVTGGTLLLSGSEAATSGGANVVGSSGNNASLKVNGILNGGATVSGGGGGQGFIGGSGTINGGITVSAGGVLAPGDPTIMTSGSSVTINNGGAAAFAIAASRTGSAPNTVTPGNNYDQVSLTGGATSNLTFSGSTALTLNIASTAATTLKTNQAANYNGTATSGVTNATLDNYFVFRLSGGTTTGDLTTLTLVDSSNDTLTGTILYGQFANASIGEVTIGNGSTFDGITNYSQTFAISYTGNYSANSTTGGQDVVLTAIAPIPEPATWGMILSGFGMLIGFQRLRRKGRNDFAG